MPYINNKEDYKEAFKGTLILTFSIIVLKLIGFIYKLPLSYILGDEGSGAHLGRQLVSDCIKKQLSNELRQKFMDQYRLDVATILERVYHTPLPNRWLASFTPFLYENKENPEIKMLLKNCFKQFFQRNTMVYRRSWLPIHVIGGVGVHFANEIKETAESLGLSIGNIVESPMAGLIEYHKTF